MQQEDDDRALEATAAQLTELRRLGRAERNLDGLSLSAFQEWIAQLRAERHDAGPVGRG